MLVAQAFYIPSESMLPTLKVNDRVLVSRLAYDLHDPNRGDIVVFTAPNDVDEDASEEWPTRLLHHALESIGVRQPSTEDYIKRVIGLPGETVEGHDGQVWVDGRALSEPYLSAGETITDFDERKVGRGELFVMGDNRDQSSDSRAFGPIDQGTIVGRAILRIWPYSRLGFL